MSREIKFKQYWRNDDTGTISTAIHSLNQLKSGISGVDRHTLIGEVQYTSLRDKNGVDLFEGDIVAYCDGELSFDAKVDYAGWEFYLDCFETNEGLGFEDLLPDRELEVIGNIYENPELLETTS